MEPSLRHRVHEIVFESETRAGRLFDLALTCLIVLSVLLVTLESVASIRAVWGPQLRYAELVLTGLFTVEYALRLYSVTSRLRYIRSFYGLIDLLAILPTWLDLFFPGFRAFMSLRTLRLLRVFRMLKLVEYLQAGQMIVTAMKASRKKISVFVFSVLILSFLFGTAMYAVEGEEHGYSDIPTSIYWAVVTMTTVGYGDISPGTPFGKFIAVILMMMGFGILAVPTGIVTAEMASQHLQHKKLTEHCPHCQTDGHDLDALFCRRCGHRLNEPSGKASQS